MPLCGGTPIYDPTQKKTIVPPVKEQAPRVRCPECGRGVVLKELPKPYMEEFVAKEQAESAAKQEEAERLARLADEHERQLRQAAGESYLERTRKKK